MNDEPETNPMKNLVSNIKHFWGNQTIMVRIGIVVATGTLIFALLAPYIAPYNPNDPVFVSVQGCNTPPDATHWLGTDDACKDVCSIILYGMQVSVLVGLGASAITTILGGIIGIIAGFWGGKIEIGLMRLTDMVIVLPGLPIMILLVAILDTNLGMIHIILVISLLGWTKTARLVYAQTRAVKHKAFFRRSEALGASRIHRIFHHLLPLLAPLLFAQGVLFIAEAILSESILSFLGFSSFDTISLGKMLDMARQASALTAGHWWVWLPPGVAIVWVVLVVTFLGLAIENAQNQHQKVHYLSDRCYTDNFSAAAVPNQPYNEVSIPDTVTPLLAVQDLTIAYLESDSQPKTAITQVSFSLQPGEILGIIGESGSGKTTLARSLVRLPSLTKQEIQGSVLFQGQDLMQLDEPQLTALRAKEIAFIPQSAMNALNPLSRVGKQIAEVLQHHLHSSAPETDINERINELFDWLKLDQKWIKAYPHEYSGGMQQRAIIAMALACLPKIVIADEPTSALDVLSQDYILKCFVALRQQHTMSFILVTHDLGVASKCDHVLVMKDGQIVEQGKTDTLFAAPKHAHTQQLIQHYQMERKSGKHGNQSSSEDT
jgi:ABC-type dipeptide/oligopeptide/nickel transport system ATPase component/ABC-type dipeptide/oligopeptide/nickel transport system permease subunit